MEEEKGARRRTARRVLKASPVSVFHTVVVAGVNTLNAQKGIKEALCSARHMVVGKDADLKHAPKHLIRDSKFNPKIISLAPLTHSFRVSEVHCRPSTKRWKVSCFRNEELSFDKTNQDNSGEEILNNELQISETEKPSAGKRCLIGLEQVADAFCRLIGKPWTVPWTAKTILQVTLLWVISFWFVGSWMIPFGAHLVGFNKESLTYRGQALFSLLTDITEGLAGILIIHRCLSRFRPLPLDLFRFSLRGKWLFDVLLGCFMFPLVNRLSQFNLDLLPVLPSTPVTLSSVKQSIMARDPVAMAL